MNTRLTTQERIQVILLQAKFDNLIDVQRQWKNHFTTEPPSKPTIISLVKKFKETGSVHDLNRSARSRSVVTEEAMKTVNEALEKSSNTSVRRGALAMEMSKSSYHRLVIEAGFRAYHPTQVQELSEDDFDRRVEFCETMLAKFNQNDRLVNKIIWSDESQFMLNGTINRHNCIYWASSNPHEQIPVSNSKLGVMVWCGVTSDNIFLKVRSIL